MPGRVTELLEALQRMPIGFGMARRTREQVRRVVVVVGHVVVVVGLGIGTLAFWLTPSPHPTPPQCKKLAERLQDKEHIFLLGKGYGEPIALEGALKLKEMAYIHAEGYSGGALKHGPFALIEGQVGRSARERGQGRVLS